MRLTVAAGAGLAAALVVALAVADPALAGGVPACPSAPRGAAPALSISLWYGERLSFGRPGRSLPVGNLLGRVAPAARVARLELVGPDGAATALAVGPDRRRLAAPGDFNAELALEALAPGRHAYRLRARDRAGHCVERPVVVRVEPPRPWPLALRLRLDPHRPLPEQVQVVDGRWRLSAHGARTVEPGYDRMLVVGDRGWTDYLATADLVVHRIDRDGDRAPSNGPLVGLALRWPGHTPRDGRRPATGWWPLGALAALRWHPGETSARPVLVGNRGVRVARGEPAPEVRPGTALRLAAAIRGVPGGVEVALAWWRPADPARRPRWRLGARIPGPAPRGGALAVVAHHVDVTVAGLRVSALGRAAGAGRAAPGE